MPEADNILQVQSKNLSNQDAVNMRAKRSKKYRKIMHTYQLHFAFREPYQVLMDSNFLRATYAFHMPIQQFLENTLHGKALPYITQCTLAKVMEGYTGKGRGGRPEYLPPPTDVPLRYCKHKDNEGNERGAIPEAECLTDLISGQAKGNEVKKNKQHYILAAADWDEGLKGTEEREKLEKERLARRKRGFPDEDARHQARLISGVPIIYVKRSVMILEEPGLATERAIRGAEKEKFKEGLSGAIRGLKRKREDEHSDTEKAQPKSAKPKHKTKAPNPLSIKKKKTKSSSSETTANVEPGTKDSTSKSRRRGKRGKGTKGGLDDEHQSVAESAKVT